MCSCMQLCAVVCSCMQLCAVVCSCVQLYAVVCSCMQLCAVVCSCMQLCAVFSMTPFGSNIPIVTALFVKFARRRFRRSFIPSIIILFMATCLRHNINTTLFITSKAGGNNQTVSIELRFAKWDFCR